MACSSHAEHYRALKSWSWLGLHIMRPWVRCREQTLGASIGTTIWLLIWLATVLSGSVRILDKDLVSDHVKPRPKSKQTSLTFHHASSFSTWVTREMLFMQYFPSGRDVTRRLRFKLSRSVKKDKSDLVGWRSGSSQFSVVESQNDQKSHFCEICDPD